MTRYCGILATSKQCSREEKADLIGHYVDGKNLGVYIKHCIPVDKTAYWKKLYDEYTSDPKIPFYQFVHEETNADVLKGVNGDSVLKGNPLIGVIIVNHKMEVESITLNENPVGCMENFIIPKDGDNKSLMFTDAKFPHIQSINSQPTLLTSIRKDEIDTGQIDNYWSPFRPNRIIIADITDPNMRMLSTYGREELTSDEWELKYRPIYNKIPDNWYLTVFEFSA